MKKFDRKWYIEKNKAIIKEEAKLRYKDKIKVWLGLPISELKDTPLFKMIMKKYPDIDPSMTLDEARIIKLFEKIFVESSQKALEFSYKLDGSTDDMSIRVSYDDLYEELKEVK